ncbi:MAG: FHA domain-containing protein [Planctomycetota bacterium]
MPDSEHPDFNGNTIEAGPSCDAPAHVVVIRGAPFGRAVPLSGAQLSVGRHPDCDLVLESSAVSRRHAQIVAHDGVFFVEDAGSRNGVFLNGTKLDPARRHALRHKDVLSLSDCRLLFLTCRDEAELQSLATIHLDRDRIGQEAEKLLDDFLGR